MIARHECQDEYEAILIELHRRMDYIMIDKPIVHHKGDVSNCDKVLLIYDVQIRIL